MFSCISRSFAGMISNHGIISAKKINIYAYGFELLLSTVAGVIMLALISLFNGEPLLWMPFLLGFIPQRLSGGGFHAHTHGMCISIFSISYFIVLLISEHLPAYSWLVSGLVTLIVLIAFSPLEAENKPLKTEQRQENRKKSLTLGASNAALAGMFLLVEDGDMRRYLTMYLAGGSMAGLSILVAAIIKKFGRKTK